MKQRYRAMATGAPAVAAPLLLGTRSRRQMRWRPRRQKRAAVMWTESSIHCRNTRPLKLLKPSKPQAGPKLGRVSQCGPGKRHPGWAG